jgi:hypothetical protein
VTLKEFELREILSIVQHHRDKLMAELEAANQHVKILQEQREAECNRRRLRITVETHNPGGIGLPSWHTLIQARTDPAEPPDVDDSSYHPDIHQAVHHAWTILNRLQGYFKDPYAKEEPTGTCPECHHVPYTAGACNCKCHPWHPAWRPAGG